MIRKKLLPLLALLTAGCVLFLSGCSVDVTTINEEEISIEAEIETQNLADGMIMLHTVWYDPDGAKLSSVDIAFYDGDTLVYSGTTNEEGVLPTCALPCNTEIFCSVSDMSGDSLAETIIIIKLSDDYSELSIYPTVGVETEETTPQCVIEAPTDRTNVRAAIFLTDEGAVNFASLTPYVEPEAEIEEPVVAEEEEAVEAEEAAEVAEEVVAEEVEEAVEEAEGENAEGGEGENAEGGEGENAEGGEGENAEGGEGENTEGGEGENTEGGEGENSEG